MRDQSEPSIALHIQKDSPLPFACGRAGRFRFHFDVTIEAGVALHRTDEIVLTFRDLFDLSEEPPLAASVVRFPLGRAVASGDRAVVPLTLSDAQASLRASAYHVRADLERGTRRLTGPACGSAEVYLATTNESSAHVIGSYLCARSEFSWNRRDRMYFLQQATPLPASWDPLSAEHVVEYAQALGKSTHMAGELVHDGAMGLLHAARVFRALGETDRMQFCERALRRNIEDVVFGKMLDAEGAVHDLKDIAAGHAQVPQRYDSYQGHIMKFLAQAAFYFRDEAVDVDYARSIHERMKPMGAWLFRRPLLPGAAYDHEPTGCKVYDGRLLQGGCEWLNLHHAVVGNCPPDALGNAMVFAIAAGKHALAHQGWYDADCYTEGTCHVICGNMNILGGLLAARRLALRHSVVYCGGRFFAPDQQSLLCQLDPCILSLLEFVTCRQTQVTGLKMQVSPGLWGIGHFYEILEEAMALYPQNVHIPGWMRLLEERVRRMEMVNEIGGFHRLNALVPVLRACPEYLATKEKSR
jgi:hypothetical protein